MAYVVVVFAIINTLALAYAAIIVMGMREDILASVETVIQDEVRKQDDRIEKRQARAAGPAEDAPPTPPDGLTVGQPYRR